MPKIAQPLTDKIIQRLTKGSKTDGLAKGLQVQVLPDCRKRWTLNFTDASGNRNTRRLGFYPEVTLAQAREQTTLVRAALLQGTSVDLMLGRAEAVTQSAAEKIVADEGLSLKSVVTAYLIHYSSKWSEANKHLIENRLEKDILPTFGNRPIRSIEGLELLDHLKGVHARAPETSHRLYSVLAQLWRFAILYKYALTSPLASFKTGDIGKVAENHLDAIIDPGEFGALMRQIKEFPSIVTRAALLVSAHCFVRSSELRYGRWDEVDLERREWIIAKDRMKVKVQDHLIPLSTQVVQILSELRKYTGDTEYLFPSHVRSRPISNGTIGMALKRFGVKHTQHGFRASFRTFADERLRIPVDIIEHQLAHTVKDPLGRAYNRTSKIEERRHMMQAYSDYIDSL
jgi:integrase